MKRIIFIILSFLIISPVYTQEYNYARLSVLYGGSIPFNFNSMDKYRTGIEIQDGTILGISLADSMVFGNSLEGFDLNIRTFNGYSEIKGEVGSISLNKIRIRADNYLGLGEGISNGYIDLSSVWTNLFSFMPISFSTLTWQSHQLSISYECGKPVSAGGNGTLLGEEPDYYTIELEMEIVPNGPGF